MAQKTIQAEQLTEGTSILIRGNLAFSRLTSLIEGEELRKSVERQVAQNNQYPDDKPHTVAHLHQARVLYGDESNPTVEEQFVAERCYTSNKRPETGQNYRIASKGTLALPVIAIPAENEEGKVEQDTSGRELAPGLDVTLVLQTYKPKTRAKRGISIQQVIVNEPVRYYSSGGVDTTELKARGIEFVSTPQAVNPSQASTAGPVPEEPAEEALPSPQPSPAPSAAPPAWAQQAPQTESPVASAPAPQEQETSPADELARLKAENEQLKNAGSAVGPGQENPWENDPSAQAGITYAAS